MFGLPKYQRIQSALATELADMGPELLDVSGASASTRYTHEQLIAHGDRDRANPVSDMIIERAERTQDPDLLMTSYTLSNITLPWR